MGSSVLTPEGPTLSTDSANHDEMICTHCEASCYSSDDPERWQHCDGCWNVVCNKCGIENESGVLSSDGHDIPLTFCPECDAIVHDEDSSVAAPAAAVAAVLCQTRPVGSSGDGGPPGGRPQPESPGLRGAIDIVEGAAVRIKPMHQEQLALWKSVSASPEVCTQPPVYGLDGVLVPGWKWCVARIMRT